MAFYRSVPAMAAIGVVVVGGVIAAGLALGLGGLAKGSAAGPTPTSVAAANPNLDPGVAAGGTPAPDFTLTDQSGRPVSLHQLRGKVVILAFVDSQCTTVCPLTTSSMVEATTLLGKDAQNVALVGINANPQAASVADVHAYSVAHGMPSSWLFLTGTPSQLQSVWKAYKVFSVIQNGGIDHEPAIYVIDPAGREQEVYITQMAYGGVVQQGQLIADEVAKLLPGHPQPEQVTPLNYLAPIAPTDSVSLPSATPDPHRPNVQLGPGQAHVVIFFATWLSETSNLATSMAALNGYQAIARSQDLPGLVAVDSAITEPTPDALGKFLAGTSLNYPVVVDKTGRVSDGYQVQDQPWIVVTDSTGHIDYSHDGWLTAAQLASAVHQALGS